MQSYNGVFNGDSTRGDFGIFERIDSAVATIIITDPCNSAVVNSDDGLDLGGFFAPNGVSLANSIVYEGPTNSVGYLEGSNLYTLCGPLTYEIKKSASEPNDKDWFKFTKLADADPDNGDSFKFEIE